MGNLRAGIAVAAVMAAAALGGVMAQDREETPLTRSAVFQWEALTPHPTKIGFRREVVRRPTATLEELESHVTTLDAGRSPHPPHQHVNEELIILKEGAVEAYVNGEWVPVATGGIIFFGSNEPHTVRNVGETPATYYVVNWVPKGLKDTTAGR